MDALTYAVCSKLAPVIAMGRGHGRHSPVPYRFIYNCGHHSPIRADTTPRRKLLSGVALLLVALEEERA